MAKMRVMDLAKEFGMDSKDLLSRIQSMKIPAKSHASILSDSNVDAIRKALAPELAQAQVKVAGVDDEEIFPFFKAVQVGVVNGVAVFIGTDAVLRLIEIQRQNVAGQNML